MSAPAVPILGQPFTLLAFAIPVNVTLACHCSSDTGGAPATVEIVASAPTPCPVCHRVYSVVFNPSTGQLQVSRTEADQAVTP